MPARPCLKCGSLIPAEMGSYCPRHLPSWPSRHTPGRKSAEQRRFREAVLAKAGHRCEAIVGGERCIEVMALHAHHLRPLQRGGSNDPGNGAALCPEHHRVAERGSHPAA